MVKPGTLPLATQTEVRDGCPLDCGLCPDHEQHACLGIIEANAACNLDCPLCSADSAHQPDWSSLTRDQVEAVSTPSALGAVVRHGIDHPAGRGVVFHSGRCAHTPRHRRILDGVSTVPVSGPSWWVLHVDLDEFIAAVEIARRPELRGEPVVVGGKGDPTQRAVVATASYAARAFGIHSGMPLRTAARRCPDAVFLPSDPPAYEAVSERVMAALRELPVVVEVAGWDEAFLGAHTDDPEALATDVRRAVKQATGLSCSVGIGDNRLRAKLATGFAKPAGVYRLTEGNWMRVMGDRPTRALWGIGPKTARKLADLGITTVAQLAEADPAELAKRFGPTTGPWFRALGLGAGGTDVSAEPHVPRSRSRETTFQQNITDRAQLHEQLVVLARRVTQDASDEGRPVVRVAVKVRFAPFFTQIRSMTLPAPATDADEIARAALVVLDRFEPTRPVRLLGVRAEFAPVK